MRKTIAIPVCVAALTAATLGCNLSAPLTPTPPAVSGGTSTDGALKVSAPAPQSPSNGTTLSGDSLSGITLSAGEAGLTYAASASLQYEFQLQNSAGAVIESAVVGSPTWTQTSTLQYETRYSWRVRAVQDGVAGPWSALVSFTTPDEPDPAARCGPPFLFDPLSILQCHRAFYSGHMSPSELHAFLKGTSRHFNQAGVHGGPFGLLRKTVGNNCHGYSCDILCAGQGGGQRQYDVLLDETIPQWGAPIPRIRVDVCEIQ